jgi:hypothetical protein
MSANLLEAEVEAVSGIILSEFASDRPGYYGADPEGSDNVNESIYATVFDPVVGTVALKVVLGIAASFVGRLFYDKWKTARTRGHLESLAQEIAGRLEGELPQVEPVHSDRLRADVLAVLIQEGLSEAQANAVFDKAIAVIGDRFRR